MTFGDYDPEDGYDDNDEVDVKLDVLERAVESIRADWFRRAGRRRDALRLVDKLGRTRIADPRLDAIRAALEAL